MRPSAIVWLAAAAFVLVLAGCGSGAGSGEKEEDASWNARPRSLVEVASGEVQDPHVAVDPEDGRVYVTWAQNDSGTKEEEHGHGGGHHDAMSPEKNAYLATSDDGGKTFSDPVRVNDVDGEVFAGGNTGPKVTPLSGDGVIVSWTRMRMFSDYPALARKYGEDSVQYTFRMARSTDGGQTFQPAADAVNDGAFTSESYQTIYAADDGRMYAAWIDYRGTFQKPAYDTIGLRASVSEDGRRFGESQSLDDLSCECCDTAIAADSKGDIYLAYRDQDESGQTEKELEGGLTVRDSRVVKSTDGGKTWSDPVALHADGWEFNQCPEAGPDIDVDSNDNIHGVYYTGKQSAPPGVYYVRSTDHGASFGKPIPVMTAGFFPPATVDVAVDDGNTAWLAWDDTRQEEGKVHVGRVTPDGKMTRKKNLATGITPSVATDGDSAVVVWAEDGSLKAATFGPEA